MLLMKKLKLIFKCRITSNLFLSGEDILFGLFIISMYSIEYLLLRWIQTCFSVHLHQLGFWVILGNKGFTSVVSSLVIGFCRHCLRNNVIIIWQINRSHISQILWPQSRMIYSDNLTSDSSPIIVDGNVKSDCLLLMEFM